MILNRFPIYHIIAIIPNSYPTLAQINRIMNVSKTFSALFDKSTLKMIGGAAAGSVLSVLFLPVISRIYSPETFGLFAVLMAVYQTYVGISALTLEQRIPNEVSDTQAVVLFKTCILVAMCMALCATVVGGVLYAHARVLQSMSPHIALALALIALMCLTSGIQKALITWQIRERAFGTLSRLRGIDAGSRGLAQVGFGILSPSIQSLMSAEIGSNFIQISFLAKKLKIRQLASTAPLGLTNIYMTIARHFWPSLYNFTSILLGQINHNSLTYGVMFLHGDRYAGLLAMTLRILQAPVRLLALPVSHVFWGKSAALGRSGSSDKLLLYFKDTLKQQSIVGVVVYTSLALLCYFLFPALLGDRWHDARYLAPLVAIGTFFTFLRSVIAGIANVANLYRQSVIVDFAYFILTACCLFALQQSSSNVIWTLVTLVFINGTMTCWRVVKITNILAKIDHSKAQPGH